MSQRSKMLVQLAVMLVVAGALGLFAWFNVYKKDEQETKSKAHAEVLFAPHALEEKEPDGGAPKAEFTQIKVVTKGETTVLERAPGGEWKITAPLSARVDRLVVDQVVSQLQTAKFKTTLEESPTPEALKTYGLDAPSFTVEAVAEVNGTKRNVKLVGGIDNTFDGTLYMQRNDEKPVYQAQGGVRWALQKTTFDLREKEVFAFDEKQVVKVDVKTKNNAWTLERNPKGDWALTRPFASLADATTLTGMFGAFKQEKATGFLTDSAGLRTEKHLDAPDTDATLTFADGKTARFRVSKLVGPSGDENFALREDESGTLLATVGSGARTHLDRNPNDLKDKTIVPLKQELVMKVVTQKAGVQFTVEKDAPDASADSWKLTAPRMAKAKIYKITSMLWTISALKFAAIADAKPRDLSKYGLDAKAQFIAFYDAPSHELARFTVGKPVPGKDKQVYVKGSGPEVFEVDGSRFNELPWAVGDVEDIPALDGGH